MKKRVNNQRGAALPLVLVTLMILSIFSLTVIFLSNSNFRSERREESRTKAYYISRTGSEIFANEAVRKRKDNEIEFNIEDFVGKKSKPTKFGSGEFTISVVKVNGDDSYKVTSVGTVNNVSETTSVIVNSNELELAVSNQIFRDRALFTSSESTKMDFNSLNSGYVRGYDEKTKLYTEKGPVHTLHKEIAFNTPNDNKRVEAKTGEEVKKMITQENLIKPDFKVFRELEHLTIGGNPPALNVKTKNDKISKDQEYKSINIEKNAKLEINAEKGDITVIVNGKVQLQDNSTLDIKTKPSTTVDIHVGDIQLSNSSKLNITGGGNVNIVSASSIQVNRSIKITGEDLSPSQVTFKSLDIKGIQMHDNSRIEIKNNVKVFFYTNSGDIQIEQGSEIVANNKAQIHFFTESGKVSVSPGIVGNPSSEREKSSQIFIVSNGKEVQIGGTGSQFQGYIYAPNAKIEIEQESLLKGSFIGKEMQTGQGMKLTHAWPSDEDVAHLGGIIPNGSSQNNYKSKTYKIQRREQ